MSEDNNKNLIPSQGGIFNGLTDRIKLIFRLMGDSRVSPFLKVLPVASALYFAIPDLVLGPVDDVAIVWLGSYLFVELCPPDVVEEHLAALRGSALPPDWDQPRPPADDVVEGEFREKTP